jgi:hypothetical protein
MDGIMNAIYFSNGTGITGLRIEGDCDPSREGSVFLGFRWV